MLLFKILKSNDLNNIEEAPFKKEKDLQKLCEKNIEQIFGVKFVRSELAINNFRIDTLAFDKESKSFIVIEYKNDKNFSIIDQGYTYLSLMLNNKADFILEYNENCKPTLKKNDVDWSQSKVIFVSPVFTQYQKGSINFKDLPIELWEIKRYSNDTVYFDQIKPLGATESIKTISSESNEIKRVSKEIKIISEEDHFKNKPEEITYLYEKFKNAVLSLNETISIKVAKMFIGFIYHKKDIADFVLLKNSIKIYINLKAGQLDDPKNITKDVSNIGHWGNGAYEIQVKDDENLEYIMSLIKQSYYKKGGRRRLR